MIKLNKNTWPPKLNKIRWQLPVLLIYVIFGLRKDKLQMLVIFDKSLNLIAFATDRNVGLSSVLRTILSGGRRLDTYFWIVSWWHFIVWSLFSLLKCYKYTNQLLKRPVWCVLFLLYNSTPCLGSDHCSIIHYPNLKHNSTVCTLLVCW